MAWQKSVETNRIHMLPKYPGKCQTIRFPTHRYGMIYWDKGGREIRHEKCLGMKYYEIVNQNMYCGGEY